MECRFCLVEGTIEDKDNPLLRPCVCDGSIAYVHKICLNRWRQTDLRPNQDLVCPLCLTLYKSTILGLLRELVPQYRGYILYLMNPFIVIVAWNYGFLIFISLSLKVAINAGSWIDFYMYSHVMLLLIYLGQWFSYFANVQDKRRYLEVVIQEHIGFFVFHGSVLILIKQYPVYGGLVHHFLLPNYLHYHVKTLVIMNGQLEA